MVDVVDHETRSRMMAGIKGKNTLPEMVVRRFLHLQGFRFRLHAKKLPGHPDIILPKWNVAIFVHGCYWHRHKGCRYATSPATNIQRWQKKFDENVARDLWNEIELQRIGWRVIVVWECFLRTEELRKQHLSALVDFIRESLKPL